MRSKPSWHYWKVPVLFGAGNCVVQTLLPLIRFRECDKRFSVRLGTAMESSKLGYAENMWP